jgi:hypothetical protein
MKNIVLAALLIGALSGCGTRVVKVESGAQPMGDRMVVSIDGAWNRIDNPAASAGPAQTWTMEGLPVDQLLIYSGIKDDQAIHAVRAGANVKSFKFRSRMQSDEIVALYEGMLTRDGSSFKLVKLEPAAFGGTKGFRFEYSLTRKVDNVQLSGLGFGAVSEGELFAIVYMAPRLTFFRRHQERVEQICRSALIRTPAKGI